uniref:Ribonuclease H-like domain-containing protein n=1 Tax=Tanacetum cinerariifolium TaxID=118510 RepID=A0A699IK93_TANCI|nr:ribonuclease H-like domain-containing protein [Tanacetum cinerariifolium]
MNKASDLEDTSFNDRYVDGMQAVPPPMTGNYMPSGLDAEIDYSKFIYGPKQISVDESDSKPSEYASCESDSSVETSTSMLEPVENASKVVCEPKVWTGSPIIKKYESDSDNVSVSNVQEDKEKPSFAFTDSVKHDDPHRALKDKGIVDSGCSRHMTGNKAHLVDYQEFKGGSVAFGGSNGRITGKGKIKAGILDFEDVYYMEELKHYNLFSVSQMCDKKNKVLFTDTDCLVVDTDCLVLSSDFKFPDKNQVLLKIHRQHNMYSFNLKNIDPSEDLACLFAKTSIDESNKWHRRLGIKREYSNARTPQQNGVAERKNRTLIEAARTMLVDSFLPTTFQAEAVNTACYVLNRVLVTKPQNKTPYELLTGKQPIISYLRPFECHVTILNTIDQFGKFDGKSDSRFLVRYSLNSKAFRVYNLETKGVEENLHVNFLENKPNAAGKGHGWMFDLDYLTNSMNYKPVSVENQANKYAGPKEANNSAGTQANDDHGANLKEIDLYEEHFVLPIWSAYLTTVKSSGDKLEKNTNFKTCKKPVSQVEQIFLEELEKLKRQEKEPNDAADPLRNEATHDIQNANTSSTNLLNTISIPLSTGGPSRAFNDGKFLYPDDPSMPHLEDIYASPSEGIFTDSSYDDEGVVTDFNNLETTVAVSPTLTTRIQTIHPKTKILGDYMSAVQTRSKVNKNSKSHALVIYI